jgi:hypothetical protein
VLPLTWGTGTVTGDTVAVAKWVAPEPKVEPNYAEVTAAVKKLA